LNSSLVYNIPVSRSSTIVELAIFAFSTRNWL